MLTFAPEKNFPTDATSPDPVSGLVNAIDQISVAVQLINQQVNHFSTMVEQGANETNEATDRSTKLAVAADDISGIVRLIDNVTDKIHFLALNANIEAARAGEAGRGFSVVADEVKSLAGQVANSNKSINVELKELQTECKHVSESLLVLNRTMEELKLFGLTVASSTEQQSTLLSDITDQTKFVSSRIKKMDAQRLVDMSLSLVQLIVRNLYERTADVRWWATDESLVQCLSPHIEASKNHTETKKRSRFYRFLRNSWGHSQSIHSPHENRAHLDRIIESTEGRLGLINSFYSVYLNLVLIDCNGRVIATSRREKFPNVYHRNFEPDPWFQDAVAMTRGDQYVAAPIYRENSMDNKLVSLYATRVSSDGSMDGETTGVLGVFFDWEEQSRVIVEDEPCLREDEKIRSTVMLLDGDNRIIASSNRNLLLEKFDLRCNNQPTGHYMTNENVLVAFAKTLGYQEYSGLGWKGVIVQNTGTFRDCD